MLYSLHIHSIHGRTSSGRFQVAIVVEIATTIIAGTLRWCEQLLYEQLMYCIYTLQKLLCWIDKDICYARFVMLTASVVLVVERTEKTHMEPLKTGLHRDLSGIIKRCP